MYSKGGKVVRYCNSLELLLKLMLVTRNKKGHVIKPAPFQSGVKSGEVARIEPNKRWFGKDVCKMYAQCYFQVINHDLGNTRTITQSALQTFQEEMGKVLKDPYKV